MSRPSCWFEYATISNCASTTRTNRVSPHTVKNGWSSWVRRRWGDIAWKSKRRSSWWKFSQNYFLHSTGTPLRILPVTRIHRPLTSNLLRKRAENVNENLSTFQSSVRNKGCRKNCDQIKTSNNNSRNHVTNMQWRSSFYSSENCLKSLLIKKVARRRDLSNSLSGAGLPSNDEHFQFSS